MSDIAGNIAEIHERIAQAAARSGRQAGDVKLMAVSKFHSAEEIAEAIRAGLRLFGENRAQELAEKFPALFDEFPAIQAHFIGQLQRNKVRTVLPLVNCIQSVDRAELLTEIERQAFNYESSQAEAFITMGNRYHIDVLFEYHTGEDSKSGFADERSLVKALVLCDSLRYVRPRGFMTMAPLSDDEGVVRSAFVKLREVAQRMRARFPQYTMDELSMGMSGDYEIAIEEGATLVRIGTAIFGARA